MAARKRTRSLQEPNKRKSVLDTLRKGGSLADAADYAGITYQTIVNERKRDKEFDAAIEKARTEGKLKCLSVLDKGMNSKDWNVRVRCAIFRLERQWYEEWSKRNPEAVTPAQLSTAINKFVAGILAVIPVEFHERVGNEIQKMLDTLFPAGSSN